MRIKRHQKQQSLSEHANLDLFSDFCCHLAQESSHCNFD